jgi:integrase
MASIEKRGKNSYRLVVEAGYDAKGKRIKRYKTIKAKNKTEAKVELSKFQIEVEAGEYIAPEKMRFEAFVEEWRTKYAIGKLSPSTHRTYEFNIKNHILPVFGHLRLDQIKSIQIVTFLDELKKPGHRKDGRGDTLSSGTIEVIYRTLKNVFNKAVEWQLIKDHPMKGIKKPEVKYTKGGYYESEEAEEVILKLFDEPRMWRLFCFSALIGGLRRGEILALEWNDVNYDKSTIFIDENIPLTKGGQPIIKAPKSESSIAAIEMPQWYMDELKRHHHEWKVEKMMVGDRWQGGNREFIFHAGFGKPLYFTQPSKWWKNFLKRNNLKEVRFHDLRHSTATLLLEEDAPLKAIQERLRHANYKTTADTYSHVTKKLSKETTSKFDKFDPRKNKAK